MEHLIAISMVLIAATAGLRLLGVRGPDSEGPDGG